MLVTMVYDIENPRSTHNVMSLLLQLDHIVDTSLPDGTPVPGMLREVNPLEGGRLVELTVEIDDRYETLYYVDHDHEQISLVTKY